MLNVKWSALKFQIYCLPSQNVKTMNVFPDLFFLSNFMSFFSGLQKYTYFSYSPNIICKYFILQTSSNLALHTNLPSTPSLLLILPQKTEGKNTYHFWIGQTFMLILTFLAKNNFSSPSLNIPLMTRCLVHILEQQYK